MVDAAVFKEVAGKGELASKLSATMRERADARQRSRLLKVLEPMLVSVRRGGQKNGTAVSTASPQTTVP